MEHERMAALIKRLLENTRAGKREWSEDSSNCFSTNIGDHQVYIAEHESPHSFEEVDPDYSLGIRKKVGSSLHWIDSATDEELKSSFPTAFKSMQFLYREARRNARGVDDILGDILKDLE